MKTITWEIFFISSMFFREIQANTGRGVMHYVSTDVLNG